MKGISISIKDAQDDDGGVSLDGKMDSVRKGIDRLDPDVIVADGRGSGQSADFLEIGIEGIGELEPQAVGAAVGGVR